MDRELLIQNIRLNYSRYGVTEEVIKEEIKPLIDDSIRKGRSYDFIYFVLQLAICEEYGLEYFWCTERQMARAFGISDEKMLEIIRETNNEFDVKENRLDDFFKVPVEVGEKYFARRTK